MRLPEGGRRVTAIAHGPFMIRIVTDSTCDLPPGRLAQLDVTTVPVTITFGTEDYLEGETLDRAGFYRLVDTRGIVPKTSQPSPGYFAQTYRRLAAQGIRTILSVHVTGKLSGTAQSARMAAAMVQDEVEVHVFDSLAGSAGMGYMVLEGAELIAAGADAATVLARWEQIRSSLRIYFALDTLRYAHMSGRVGALQHTLASLLQVKPIIGLDEGLLEVKERMRTRQAALARLVELMKHQFAAIPLHVAVVHAEAPAAAQDLLARAQARLDCQRAFVAELATSLVANLGPGTLGLVAYPAASPGA